MSTVTTIFGPPGTGKTTTLSKNIARAVERFGRDQVVVASLTKTAAQEIKGRGLDVDPANVGTLHAICRRRICPDRLVIEGKASNELIAQFNAQFNHDITQTERDEDDPYGEATGQSVSDKLKEQYHLLRARMLHRSLWPRTVLHFAEEWEAFKSGVGAVDFTDMIERALMAPPIHTSAIFYDEAQDGSALELAVIKKWSEVADHTIIAGDDDQALYSWRGASVDDFISFSRPEHRIILSQSYRVPRAVHRFAQDFARTRIKYRQPKEYAPRDEDGFIHVNPHASTAYPEGWIHEVLGLIASGKSVMILASCRYMLKTITFQLKERGIAFHNPYRPENSEWNPITSTAERLLAYLDRPWSWRTMAKWTKDIDASKITRGAKSRIDSHSEDDTIVPYSLALELLGNLSVHPDTDTFYKALLEKRRDKYSYLIRIKGLQSFYENVYLRPGKGLIIGTIHSVKGGEADIVYLFPDLSPSGWNTLRQGGPAEVDGLARMFYVAITRAREGVVLCQPSGSLYFDL